MRPIKAARRGGRPSCHDVEGDAPWRSVIALLAGARPHPVRQITLVCSHRKRGID
jgi:hypothetical protein